MDTDSQGSGSYDLGKLDPDPHPHQLKIRIRIRIKMYKLYREPNPYKFADVICQAKMYEIEPIFALF